MKSNTKSCLADKYKLNSSKQRIDVFCMLTDYPGGAENILKMMAVHLAEIRPVHVIIMKSVLAGFWEDNLTNISVHYLNAAIPHLGFIRLARKMQRLSENYHIHFVYCSQSYMNGMVGFGRRIGLFESERIIFRESTNVFTRFNGLKLFLYKLPYYAGYNRADLVICQTEMMKKELLTQFKWLQSAKVVVICNPVNLKEIDEKSNLLPEINVNDFKPFLVAAGRLIPEKGFDVLIKGFKKFHDTYNNYHLLILGEGNEREYLTQLIKEYNLNNNLHLIGQIKNVYPFFREAALCIVSSIKEGFPNVLLQMMAVNDRVLSTFCADGINEIKGIKLCAPGNAKALSIAIEEEILNGNGRDEVRTYFDHFLRKRTVCNYEDSINHALEIYEQTISKP